MKHSRKSGAITVEVAIGIALAVIVVLVALGMFSENLATMVSSSGFANMFKNSNKTTYSSFERDYTNSQVNVQLIGEQGLAMLRNIANNKAIEQIDKYTSGVDTSVTNVNSIAYLTTVINAIVGSPDICVYMKKDSDKKCNQDNIGGYSYRINLNGGSITINKEGGGISSKYPTMDGVFSGGAAGFTVKAYTPNGTLQTFQPTSSLPPSYNPASVGKIRIYKYIKEISAFAEQSKTVYEYVILLKAVNVGTLTLEQLKAELNMLFSDLFNSLNNPLNSANNLCRGSMDISNGKYGCISKLDDIVGENDGSSGLAYVGDGELEQFASYKQNILNSIQNITSTDAEAEINSIINSKNFNKLILILRKDTVNQVNNKPSACNVFLDKFNNITAEYDVSAPACVPLWSP